MTTLEFKTRHENNEAKIFDLALAQQLKGHRVAVMFFGDEANYDEVIEFMVGDTRRDENRKRTYLMDAEGNDTMLFTSDDSFIGEDVFEAGDRPWFVIDITPDPWCIEVGEFVNDIDAATLIEEFKTKGYNVTEEALLHNFSAWKSDYKSGYRDEENGYFLFSPCGCNPLRFHAEKLKENAAYQRTYMDGIWVTKK